MRKIIIIGVLVVLTILVGVFAWRKIPKIEYDVKVVKVESEKYSPIYLKKIERGLNYSVSVISLKPDRDFKLDQKSEYIFSGGDTSILYKNVENDTLIVYSYHPANKPEVFDSGIKVILKEIEEAEYDETVGKLKKRGFEKL